MRQSEIAAVVRRTAALVAEHYVFAEVGSKLQQLLTERVRHGRYRHTTDAAGLAELLTTDLRSINGDRHLGLKHHPEPVAEQQGEQIMADMARQAARSMGGVARVEVLEDNVGYVQLSPAFFPPAMAGDAVVAAMQLVSRTGALIIDVRDNRGGDPATVALVCSYLFDEPTHLHTMHLRAGEQALQSWTLPYVPPPRFGAERPVFTLTGPSTFSGGEALAYDLQQLGRATVVGQPTAGGAHPRTGFRVHQHLELALPTGRPVNPVSGGNWDGAGVTPDLAVPAAQALETAHRESVRRATGQT